jgi:hypothetical protein
MSTRAAGGKRVGGSRRKFTEALRLGEAAFAEMARRCGDDPGLRDRLTLLSMEMKWRASAVMSEKARLALPC